MIKVLILFNSSNSFLKKVRGATAFWRELMNFLRKALNTFSFSPTLQKSKAASTEPETETNVLA